MSELNGKGSLVPFNYGDTQVRVVVIDGYPEFVLADLCKVLSLSNPSVVAQRLDSDALRHAYPIADAKGRIQHATLVNESGMYEVIFRSDKPEAITFRRWVTGTLLPEVRRTGSFNAQPALAGPELMAAGYAEAMKTLEARDARIFQLEQKNTTDAPKVSYVDTYVTDADLLSFSTVASTNGVTEKWLRQLLIEKDWIYCQSDSRWSEKEQKKVTRNRYSEKSDKKRYFRRVEVHEAPRFRGSEVMHTLKITPQGAEAIARLVAKEQAA
ncbi:BRO family protein [Mycolicibacterium fluoranthenivorans]|uniref:Prophage antirepressor-like protein n=1 Tax=Mycolicibacterium fluoranthenivorans TaxID=258505 RepID=A0A7X5ZGB9_9MYCO|nr:BRO family protein [Mycolicibacterium fluoranthenivorans]NIH98952.1 prophage antirepressor-like protein [Mycolicibacterium fluoranthenivorans]